MIALKHIDPDEVRAFQRSCYEDFYENVLQKMLAFPLWMLNQKKIKAELHVYGSTAREELVPFSDLEVIFLLEESNESNQMEQNGLFLGSIIEWIGIQITALGESQTLPEELAPLIDGMPPKGLSLDSTPNLAVLPLRAMNASLPICMTTLSTLCKFQQEGQLIQEEKEKLLETRRQLDRNMVSSKKRRLERIYEESTDSQVQKELYSLIEHLKRLEMPQFNEGLNTLKGRVCQESSSIAFIALRQQLEEFEQQNQRDLDVALETHRLREKAFQELSKEIETRPTQLLLFSLLKTKKIAASSGADFHYEQERCVLLNETINGSLS